jgi:UDPglucose 6-dehydrogenase
MFNTVSGKKIAIWGFAFKKDTNDTRESAAIYVCRDLLEERAKLSIYDPRVTKEQVLADLREVLLGPDGRLTEANEALLRDHVEVVNSSAAAARDAHAIAVLTEWDEFKQVDFQAIHTSMKKPAFVFDGRNILKKSGLSDLGFQYFGIGF